jgi:hypothetical protein
LAPTSSHNAARGEDQRRFVEEERAIEFAHAFARALVIGADDDAVRALEIVDRRAFAQEFRVGDDGEIRVRPRLLDDRFDFVAGADRHRRFGDDDRVAVHQAGDFFRRRIDVGEVRMPVAAARGRADGDEHRVGLADRLRRIGGEEQPALLDVILHQLIETRFEDRNLALLQARNFARVLIDARHRVAEIGEARAGDKAHIAGADHGDAHGTQISWL